MSRRMTLLILAFATLSACHWREPHKFLPENVTSSATTDTSALAGHNTAQISNSEFGARVLRKPETGNRKRAGAAGTLNFGRMTGLV